MAVDVRKIRRKKSNAMIAIAKLSLHYFRSIPRTDNKENDGGRIDQLKLFAYIAIIILIMACILSIWQLQDL